VVSVQRHLAPGGHSSAYRGQSILTTVIQSELGAGDPGALPTPVGGPVRVTRARSRFRPRHGALSLGARDVGPLTILGLVIAWAGLWLMARPASIPFGSFFGQMLGAESVLLLSVALVLISTLPYVEAYFDGIDRAAVWHRRAAILGVLLLVPHIALSRNPGRAGTGGQLGALGMLGLVGLAAWAVLPRWRSVLPKLLHRPIDAARSTGPVRLLLRLSGGYERWRALHRTTGVFVAIGFAHGAMNGTPFAAAPILRFTYLVVGGVGLAFFVHKELIARFFARGHDYCVRAIRPVDHDLVEITLKPLCRPIRFVPGQFATVFLEAKDGWHRHPFTIASGPTETDIRFTIKALGDYTSQLRELIEPGMPAVISGPHGRFDRRRGTAHHIWIAAGVGIAPFLSWMRSLGNELTQDVDLFYSSQGAAPFADELTTIAARHPSLRLHLIDTATEGHLTPTEVLARTPGPPHQLSAFMCGPEPMLREFQTQLRTAGIRRSRIHREHLDWR
jgi:predicted ferric reductase